jgi:hypothetical protein
MKQTLLVLFVLLFVAVGGVKAGVADGPDYTLLWNRYTSVTVVDSFVIGIAPKAIVVSRYDDTLGLFVPVNPYLMESNPVSFKRYDTLLIVKTTDEKLAFFSLSSLPELTYLGLLDPGVSFEDFAIRETDLYLSRWFNGIWRFVRQGYESVVFADSIMTGVLITQLQIVNDTLYALDEYNGIMRFDLSGPGRGRFIDYLWIPFQATSFVHLESQVVITTINRGVLLGEFGRQGSGIVDSIPDITGPLSTIVADSLLIFPGVRTIDVVNRFDLGQRFSFAYADNLADGDFLVVDNQPHLLLPHISGGLTLYNLADSGRTREAAYRGGPITDLVLYSSRLYTGGATNPIDVYTLDSLAAPGLAFTMYPDLKNVKALDHNGDTLIVYYQSLNKVAFISRSAQPDSFLMESSFFVEDSSLVDIQFLRQKRDTVWPLLTYGGTRVDFYAVTDSSGTYHASTYEFVGRIESALAYDTLLFVATNKNLLWILRITPSLEITPLSVIDFENTPAKIMIIEGRVAVFTGAEMVVYDFSDPEFPMLERTVTLMLPVQDAALHGDKLYTVGPLGVAVYELYGLAPDIMEYGGRSGSLLKVIDGFLATSDGGAIHIYKIPFDTVPPVPSNQRGPTDFALRQNYPNPFNAVTTIDYSVPKRAQVKIAVYNLLGQVVRVLVDEEKPQGDFTTRWDGRNHAGIPVGSGVYFCRFSADDFTDCKKMLFVK